MKRGFVLATVLLVATLNFTSCGDDGGRHAADVAGQKIYRHTFDQAPRNLDPVLASSLYINFIVLNTYDTLFGYKYLARPYALKTNLAEAMPVVSDDGLIYTIRLKKGVLFMDDPAFAGGKGREVTAHDFVYSLKRHFDPASLSQGAWYWQGRIVGLDEWGEQGADYDKDIAGLKALDDHTIQITLTRPYPQLTHSLAQGFSALVPHEAIARYGREISVRPVGSGPFMLTSFDTTRAVLVRNPNYRREPVDIYAEGYEEAKHGFSGVESIHGKTPPFVDRVEISFIADDSARMTSFIKDTEAQYARMASTMYDQYLSSKDPIKLKDEYAGKYSFLAGIEPAFVFHTFNMLDESVGVSADPQTNARNKALRCAIIKGFDWQDRNERFYSAVGQIFPGIIPPAVPEFDPTLTTASIDYDPEGARRLLADAGWNADTLPRLVYGVPTSVRQIQMFEQFRGFMQKIGYPKEKIVLKEFATFGDIAREWRRARLPLVTKAWSLDFPDAENTLQLFYGPNGSPGSNDANYRNVEYDRLFEHAAVMQPGPERTELYQRMNRMVIDDCLAMTGLSRTIIQIWHKDVIGYPDRNIVGGFWLKFVALRDTSG